MRTRDAVLISFLMLAGCGPKRTPPPKQMFAGLPVSGSLADAHSEGFTRCVELTKTLRCRRPGVTIEGQGPFEAAVDLVGRDGSGGFDQLTLWHDTDPGAVLAVGEALVRKGWQSCLTGDGTRGEFQIHTREGAPVRFAIDISYWGKRRVRAIPEWNSVKPMC